MRKVFAGILLALSLPAMADLAADLQTMSPAAALQKAKQECGANCNDAELVNVMLQNGVPAQAVAQAAKASGIAPATVAQAIASTGVPASIAVQIVLSENPEARSNPQLVAQITNAAVNAPRQAPALGGVGGQPQQRVVTPVSITPTNRLATPVVPPVEPAQARTGSPT